MFVFNFIILYFDVHTVSVVCPGIIEKEKVVVRMSARVWKTGL